MGIKSLQEAVVTFRDERDWKQFHNPKDLATTIAIEASELQEPFLKIGREEAFIVCKTQQVADEVADILNGLLLFCDVADIHLNELQDTAHQDHNPIDLTISIAREVSRLQEKFLWKPVEDSYTIAQTEKVRERINNLYALILNFCAISHLDLEGVFMEKLERNAKKYPIDKSKGQGKRYDEL